MDERFGGERQPFPPSAAALLEAERDMPVFTRFQAVVGQGNPVDVGGEVGEHLRAGARRLAVGHPILVPNLGWHGIAEAGGGQRRFELTPEEPGERADGHEPGCRTGCEPLHAFWGQAPPRDEIMDMGMVGQVPGPGVEDAHHADLPAEVMGVQREGL